MIRQTSIKAHVQRRLTIFLTNGDLLRAALLQNGIFHNQSDTQIFHRQKNFN